MSYRETDIDSTKPTWAELTAGKSLMALALFVLLVAAWALGFISV